MAESPQPLDGAGFKPRQFAPGAPRASPHVRRPTGPRGRGEGAGSEGTMQRQVSEERREGEAASARGRASVLLYPHSRRPQALRVDAHPPDVNRAALLEGRGARSAGAECPCRARTWRGRERRPRVHGSGCGAAAKRGEPRAAHSARCPHRSAAETPGEPCEPLARQPRRRSAQRRQTAGSQGGLRQWREA